MSYLAYVMVTILALSLLLVLFLLRRRGGAYLREIVTPLDSDDYVRKVALEHESGPAKRVCRPPRAF